MNKLGQRVDILYRILPLYSAVSLCVHHSLQLIAVRGTLESPNDCNASYAGPECFTSPFACFVDFASQNDFNNSSNVGVLSSSIDSKLGRLNDLFLGVEQDDSSTCK